MIHVGNGIGHAKGKLALLELVYRQKAFHTGTCSYRRHIPKYQLIFSYTLQQTRLWCLPNVKRAWIFESSVLSMF